MSLLNGSIYVSLTAKEGKDEKRGDPEYEKEWKDAPAVHDDGSGLVAHVRLDAAPVLQHGARVRAVVVAPVRELELLDLPLLFTAILQKTETGRRY